MRCRSHYCDRVSTDVPSSLSIIVCVVATVVCYSDVLFGAFHVLINIDTTIHIRGR